MVSSNQVDLMMAISLVFSMAVGYYVFVPKNPKSKYSSKIPNSAGISEILPYALLAAFIFMLMNLETTIENFLGLEPYRNYDQYMLMLEGNKVYYFQSLVTPMLTYFSGIIYLLGFSFLLIFTFVILLSTRNTRTLKEYLIALVFICLASYPFYIFFPVNVTCHVLPGMVPLLYQMNPAILRIATICDPGLNNCFPSLHASISVVTTLFIFFRTDLERYKFFAVMTTISILFAILYLGIHWITDMIGGIILAFIAYFIAIRSFTTR